MRLGDFESRQGRIVAPLRTEFDDLKPEQGGIAVESEAERSSKDLLSYSVQIEVSGSAVLLGTVTCSSRVGGKSNQFKSARAVTTMGN